MGHPPGVDVRPYIMPTRRQRRKHEPDDVLTFRGVIVMREREKRAAVL